MDSLKLRSLIGTLLVGGVVAIALALCNACEKGPLESASKTILTKVFYGDVRFHKQRFQVGTYTDEKVALSTKEMSPEFTALIYRGQRIEIRHDGKDLERIKMIFTVIPLPVSGGEDWYRAISDKGYPDRKCLKFVYPGDQECLQVDVDLSGRILGLETFAQPMHRRNARGELEDITTPDPMQVEFRGKLLRSPFYGEDLDKALGPPDWIERQELDIW